MDGMAEYAVQQAANAFGDLCRKNLPSLCATAEKALNLYIEKEEEERRRRAKRPMPGTELC